MPKDVPQHLSRNDFLRVAGVASVALLLPGCEGLTPEFSANETRTFELLDFERIYNKDTGEYLDPVTGQKVFESDFKASSVNGLAFLNKGLFRFGESDKKRPALLWANENFTVEIANSDNNLESSSIDFFVSKDRRIIGKMSDFSDFSSGGLEYIDFHTLGNEQHTLIGMRENLFVLNRSDGSFRRERKFTSILSINELDKVIAPDYEKHKQGVETSINRMSLAGNLLKVETKTPIGGFRYGGGSPNVPDITHTYYGHVYYIFEIK
jgi:hypothetical protein